MRMIGPFEIHDPIARGGHAVVHAARWPGGAPERSVVAKVANAGAELALHHENIALRTVEHPNVIAPVGLVDDATHVALVLPRAACSLRAHAGRLDDAQVFGLLAALAGGLYAIHRRGLVHGDVSASNVLLFDGGTPVLGDLGGAEPCTGDGVSADVAALARTARETLAPGPDSELRRVLATFERSGGDAPALHAALAALDAAPGPIDPHAAPPVAVEPPTMIVE